ncbi:hypothetical protein BH09BAC5_BH09BAC5_15400 [soil metagenome]
MYEVKNHKINVDFGKLYGTDFSVIDQLHPESVMLAEGSEIIVRSGNKLK